MTTSEYIALLKRNDATEALWGEFEIHLQRTQIPDDVLQEIAEISRKYYYESNFTGWVSYQAKANREKGLKAGREGLEREIINHLKAKASDLFLSGKDAEAQAVRQIVNDMEDVPF